MTSKQRFLTEFISFNLGRDSLLNSIDTYANGPWLRLRNECFGSIKQKVARCLEVFRGGEGGIYELDFITLAGRWLVASGCEDGNVRVHDVDARGEYVCELTGHYNAVTDVAVARSMDDECCFSLRHVLMIARSGYGVFGCHVRRQQKVWGAVRGI